MKIIEINFKQILLLFFFSFSIINSIKGQSAFSVGPRIGVNFANVKYSDYQASYNYSTSLISGFEAGIIGNYHYNHLQIQAGILYSQKGFVLNGNLIQNSSNGTAFININESHTFNCLTIPLTLAYTQKKSGQGIQLLTGFYVSSLLGGRVIYDNSQGVAGITKSRYQDEAAVKAGNSFTTTNEFYSHRIDMGLQLGAGYRYSNFIVQTVYALGLRNLGSDLPMNPNPDGPKYYNRSLNVNLTYVFPFSNFNL